MSTAPVIAVLVGSLREGSFNRMTAEAIEKGCGDRATFKYVDIGHVGLYNQDSEKDWPDNWRKMKDEIRSADGVLFVTPEYNRSIPGVLKNAMDIASRPYGDSAFAGKPAAVIGASQGKPGTSMAQQHLRNVLSYLDMRVMCQPEAYVQITGEGKLDDGTVKFLEDFGDAMLEWIDQHA